jgi:hypothetical protein
MIEFRKKSLIQDLMPEAIEYLKKEKVKFNTITEDQADQASRVNSKAMVLRSFIRNEHGMCQIQVQDKELYKYTQKLVRDIFQMRITNIDTKNRIITAERPEKGIVLDIIEILGVKYNLSIVM